ncbi:leucine-rich repeat domain-containing protein [Zavarzinella formosa]|uniref:hypothetical protein n=1 Tax=Zavarzinella formosa TaxID=360055 RepID=UPI0002D2BF8E|nr:hypothetical protein [Zavarzinella formosa]
MIRSVLAVLCLMSVSVAVAAEPKTPPQPPKELVKAWEEAGAEFAFKPAVGFKLEVTLGELTPKPKPGTVLTFIFGKTPKIGWDKLPLPKQPFRLEFVAGVTEFDDESIKGITRHQELVCLDLGVTDITNAGLKEIVGLKNLKSLRFLDPRMSPKAISDDGLKQIGELKQLTELVMMSFRFTDDGLKYLASLNQLTSLSVSSPRITDKGLKHLVSLKQLAELDLSLTNVTAEGAKELQMALPKVKIKIRESR